MKSLSKYKYFMVEFRHLFAIMSKPLLVLFEEEEVVLQVFFKEAASLEIYLSETVETTGIV